MYTPAVKLHPWRLVLDDEEHGQIVLAAIHEIERALVVHLEERELSSTSNVYLSEGTAGIAIFLAYLQTAGYAPLQQLALDCLAPAMDALTTQPMAPSLYAG